MMTNSIFDRLHSICPNHILNNNNKSNKSNNGRDGLIKLENQTNEALDNEFDQLFLQSNPQINGGWDITTMPWL